ncbi:MAG: NUDIX domain-containing protein [Actinobacteria bacterium]|nr:NUDIX domain-containing protein [Actinomycetota bacterium]MCA1719879.1 NUDIX domain-containing protein [Actinomycetota bacterium]
MPVPVVRTAGRVLLLDGEGRVLLFRGHDPAQPDAGSWWFTVGGGAEDGENPRAAAARELQEETGLAVPAEALGERVHRELAEFSLAGTDYRQDNHFFATRVAAHDVVTVGFTDLEEQFVLEHRWWTREDLRTTADTVYPPSLVQVLDRLDG